MHVDILGPFRVRDGAAEVDLGGPRSRALIARLALDPGRTVSVDGLVDALWGTDVPADAHNALQSVVSRTRRRLPDGALRSDPGGYALDLPSEAIDAHRFERLVREGRPHDALATWRGDALGDLRGAAFADAAAARLEELRLGALEDRIAADLTAGRADRTALVAELDGLTAGHPYREGFWALLMRALVADGRQADALTAYERMRARLAGDLGIDPSARLQDLHLAILRGDASLITPAGPTRATSPDPRSALTSFVGREEALEQIRDLLAEHRLVTLVGPGGAGKTRLATEAMAMLADRVPDGTWIVELASVTDDADIVNAFVAALGLREVVVLERTPGVPRADPRERLLEVLRDKSALILVDNCEHLIGGVAVVLEDLLGHVPGLRVLATSREPVSLTGEVVRTVPALDQPPPGCTPEDALGFSAVRLFVDRARAAVPTFELDGRTLAPVLEICERLDGLPLAIELAAARLRVLTVTQVAARLGDRFRLLTAGSRTALPRHRTLHAVVEWSWDLLTDDERCLAERAAVFPAGVTVDGAAAVVGSDDPYEALDTLTALAEKSLLVPVRDADDPNDAPRFRMLETLREYGAERLVEQDEMEAVRESHLAYFLRLAERNEPRLRGPQQLGALAVLDAEQDNILAALRFAVDQGDADAATRVVAALAWYWSLRSQHRAAGEWATTALAVPGSKPPEAEMICLALSAIGMMGSASRGTDLRELGERIEGLAEQVGERHPLVALVGAAAWLLSRAFLEPDRGDGADPGELLELFDPPDPWARAAIRFMVAAGLENQGSASATEPLLEESLAEFRGVGDRWGMAMSLGQLGTRRNIEGDHAGARAAMEEAAALLAELGADDDVLQMRSRVAWVGLGDLDETELEHARVDLRQMHEDAMRRGSSENVAVTAMNLAEVERLLGNAAASREMAGRARERLPEAVGGPQIHALLELSLAYTDLQDGQVAAAEQGLLRAAALARESRDMPVAATVAVGFAGLALARDDAVLAGERLGAAVRIRGEQDHGNADVRRLAGESAAVLGTDGYDEAYARGLALPKPEALDFACPAPQRPADRGP